MTQLTLQEVPWSRIVHWYGRASLYPTFFNAIKNGDAKEEQEAFKKVITTIEHQDGIIQVTPIALPFIFDLLYSAKTNTEELLKIIFTVLGAVNFQYEYFEIDRTLKKLTPRELIEEAFLWEEFKSDEDDELLWEEYTYEPQYWLETTAIILLEEEKSIRQIDAPTSQVQELRDDIVNQLQILKNNQ